MGGHTVIVNGLELRVICCFILIGALIFLPVFEIAFNFECRVSRELPSIEEISQDIDVDSLEASVTALGSKYTRKPGTKADGSPNKPLSPKR